MSNTKVIFSYTKNKLVELNQQLTIEYKKAVDSIEKRLLDLSKKGFLNQSDMFKFNRLEKLKLEIEKEIKTLSKNEYKLINNVRIDIFKKVYDTELSKIDQIIKLSDSFVKEVLANPLYEQKFFDSLNTLTKQNAKTINDIITQGLIQSQSITEIAKKINEKIEQINLKKSKLIAKQETLRAMSQAQLEGTEKIKSKGFKVEKVWIYNHNPKEPRPHHVAMHNQKADKDGYFNVLSPDSGLVKMKAPRLSGIASEDINCACSYVNEIIV